MLLLKHFQLLRYGNADIWIGLIYYKSADDDDSADAWDFATVRFEKSKYSNWESGQPNNSGEKLCVFMNGIGEWIDTGCNDGLSYYVCQNFI